MTAQVKVCTQAEQEHANAVRQYAHTFHKRNVICVAPEFYDLPQTHSVAILLHETGHLLCGNNGHHEATANKAIEQVTGIRIYYKDSPWGEHLEWIPSSDVPKGKAALGLGEVN